MKHFLLVFLISGCIPALAQPWLHRDNSPELDSLSFFFFGDVMQHEPQISGAWNAETADYDYLPCFQYLIGKKPIMSSPIWKRLYPTGGIVVILNFVLPGNLPVI